MIFIRKEKTEYNLPLEKLKLGEWFVYRGEIYIKMDNRVIGVDSVCVLHVSHKSRVSISSAELVKPIPDKDIDITVKVE